jgi:hypothetical protein
MPDPGSSRSDLSDQYFGWFEFAMWMGKPWPKTYLSRKHRSIVRR